MIQIQHIQELERRIQSALDLIRSLRTENSNLKKKLDGYEERIGELESLVHDFKEDQGAIESGILRALKQLDTLEDAVTGTEEANETQDKVAVMPSEAPSEPSSEEAEPETTDTGDSELDIF